MIYKSFFGLNEEPFGVTPDPKFLYISSNHAEAIAHLSHGIAQNRGFIMLTGEVGSGKTTLIRHVFENFDPKVRSAMVLNPKMNALELLKFINHDFGLGVKRPATHKNLMDTLNSFLLERCRQGETAVLAIDEAQEMSVECLEFVRLLSNLETDTNKLIQTVLVGQPELRDIVNSERLKQLNQRISVRFHLEPLALDETARYIRHRLKVAGSDTITFPEKGIKTIHDLSHGIPRLINLLCDRVLMAAYGNGESQIRTRLIKEVARGFGKEDIAPPEMRTEKRIEKPAEKRRGISLGPVFAGFALFVLFALFALFIYPGVKEKHIADSFEKHVAGIFMADGIFMAQDTALSEEAGLMNLLHIWGEEGLDASDYSGQTDEETPALLSRGPDNPSLTPYNP